MMKKYLAIAAASIIGLAGVATASETIAHNKAENAKQSSRMHQHKKDGLPRDLQALKLSSKQEAEIKKILESNRPQRSEQDRAARESRRNEFQQRMNERRAAEQKLISAKNFDEAAARRLIAERQAEHDRLTAERNRSDADRAVARLKERHAIFQVLDAKQQKQWLENQNKREKHEAFRGKRGEHRPQAQQ
ncbi:Spy/CpxP family protein refolding chaperone [Bergeriella denitrificans]|uniref:Periplasmic protein n=1 Tax=Bergeriella denitrificans TaxID=494 RepID=A0A378UI52_BERDE|nr:Spy/CpxP family protein refolding chaperone [Bergeriella denitrificans]STZ77054.1 periplasmic protein [Bergeriella denitrificans]